MKYQSLLKAACFPVILFVLLLSVNSAQAQTISTYAGTVSSSGWSGDGGAATSASVGVPNGVAADTFGNVYVSDQNNNVIRKIDASGIITTIAGNGTAGYSGDGGSATTAQLNLPQGLCVDGLGNVYCADFQNNVIRKISVSGIITTVAGVAGSYGYTGDGGAATSAFLSGADDVAIDYAGNLYIADGYTSIRMVNTAGIISTFAGNGSPAYTGDTGPATDASLDGPSGVAVDRAGNVFIADNDNNVIRKVNTSGIITTVAGNGYGAGTFVGFGGTGYWAGDGYAATDAVLNQPSGIAVDAYDNLYIADQYNDVVRFVSGSTGVISTYAGVPYAFAYGGDGGMATDAYLNNLNYCAVDKFGNLFISDYNNNVVRKVLGTPVVSITTTTDTVCAETPVTYTASLTGSGAVHYSWKINSASVGTDATVFTADSVHNNDTITCTLTDGGSTIYSVSNQIVMTVNPLPDHGTITGSSSVCLSSAISLSETVSGGTWTSSASSVASVNSSGSVSGLAVGSATISYSVTSALGCGPEVATFAIAVNTVPSAGTITGASTLCAGTSSLFTDAAGTGTWSTTDASIASVDGSGTVYGMAVGSATIRYIASNLCGADTAAFPVTISSSATAGTISGLPNLCIGLNDTLTDATTGGSWSSSAPGTATVDAASGIVTGVAAGSATISYSLTSGCGISYTTYSVTVFGSPTAGTITGSSTVCVGSSVLLADASGGGVWSSGTTSVATVDVSGNVWGASTGVATISYTVSNYCGTAVATISETVNPAASAGTISGATSVCAGSSVTLSESGSGGSWTTSSTTIATVTSSGSVSGVSAGSVTISYGVTSGCGTAYATYAFTVNPLPNAGTISGSSTVCTGASVSLTDAAGGGSWSSTTMSVATVDASGNVYGVGAGSTTINYTVTNSCGTAIATQTETVDVVPVAGTITGASAVCVGAGITLTDATGTAGGTWSSSDNSLATVDASGNTYGAGAGSVTLSYTVTSTCGTFSATYAITVNPLPNAGSITGASSVCTGSSATLTDAATGGVWTSTATSVATVDASGNVYAASTGSTTINYTVTNSCGVAVASQSVTVIASPVAGAITGSSVACVGGTLTLTEASTGGSWSSSNNSIATVDAGGIVYGVATGSVTISYTITNSCGTDAATLDIAVNTTPTVTPISGLSSVCAADSITLTDASAGGTWTSSAAAVATVGSTTGVVYGVAAGTATITYTITNACGSAATLHGITVNALPSAGTITGLSSVCPHNTIALTDAATGGVWTSGTTAVATVTAGGIATGVSAGTAIITYAVTGICGTAYAAYMITVNPDPFAGVITGADSVCIGATTTYSDTVAGGMWLSGSTSVVTIDASGMATGVSADTVNIIYSVTNVCGTVVAAKKIKVNSLLDPGTITGTTKFCAGTLTILTASVAGSNWSSSNGHATVSTGGVVTGVTAGIDTIYHNFTNSCGTASAVLIDTIDGHLTAGMLGTGDTICAGDSMSLGAPLPGGVWRLTNSNASIDSVNVLHATTAGTDTLVYTLVNTCGVSSASVKVVIRSASECGTAVLPVVVNSHELSVYPNPNNGTFNVSFSSVANETAVLIINNMLGEKVSELTILPNKDNEVRLHVSAGIYFVQAIVNGEKVTRRIVVE